MKTDEDKYSATWLSHSSISDFLTCPRQYYYANIYKNPRSGKKITIVNPFLALGQAVHGVIEELSNMPTSDRFERSLLQRYDEVWANVSGKKGGFTSSEQEQEFKDRGTEMLKRVLQDPGPLSRKALKLKDEIPNYWFSEKDMIILCGKIDWIEYLDEEDTVHVIDFKTGLRKEKGESLQLPIYLLLVKNCQAREVKKMSYWYLNRDDGLEEVPLPNYEESYERIMKIGQRIKLARQLNHFKCSVDEKEGCVACLRYKSVIEGKGEFIGIGEYGREMYILPDEAVAL